MKQFKLPENRSPFTILEVDLDKYLRLTSKENLLNIMFSNDGYQLHDSLSNICLKYSSADCIQIDPRNVTDVQVEYEAGLWADVGINMRLRFSSKNDNEFQKITSVLNRYHCKGT